MTRTNSSWRDPMSKTSVGATVYKLIWPYLSKHTDHCYAIFVISVSTHHIGDTVGTIQISKTTKLEDYPYDNILNYPKFRNHRTTVILILLLL